MSAKVYWHHLSCCIQDNNMLLVPDQQNHNARDYLYWTSSHIVWSNIFLQGVFSSESHINICICTHTDRQGAYSSICYSQYRYFLACCSVFCKFRHAVGFLCSNTSWVITAVFGLVKYNTPHYKPCHLCKWRDCGDAKSVTDLVLDSPCELTSAQAPSWITAKGRRLQLHREEKLLLEQLLVGPQSSATPSHIVVKPT